MEDLNDIIYVKLRTFNINLTNLRNPTTNPPNHTKKQPPLKKKQKKKQAQ